MGTPRPLKELYTVMWLAMLVTAVLSGIVSIAQGDYLTFGWQFSTGAWATNWWVWTR